MMNENTRPLSGLSHLTEHSFGSYLSSALHYSDIDDYFLQDIQFGNVKREPINAIAFARLLHHKIRLMPRDRNIYALEYFIGGYRCYDSLFIAHGQKIIQGNATLNVLCFSSAFLLNMPVFDKSLVLVGLIENTISNSSIVVLQEFPILL